ncbi:MAG: MerR family transcriptional regulator [Firmicutes bacterium]|nr:MerR family transcriptional regulator [Bacillota bacterium]
MRTVKEVSSLTGVSVRTLHYYDSIDLLKPTQVTESGYRLYDDTALERLQSILLFRELQFPLKDIKKILASPDFDRAKALDQQIELLELRKAHIEDLISLAREIQTNGEIILDFSAFCTTKIDEYTAKAKEMWGSTDAYKEYEEKTADKSNGEKITTGEGLMKILAEIGENKDSAADSESVQTLVAKLREYITQNYYNCTPEIFRSLGIMYCSGDEFTENIDKYCGSGTAEFAAKAIEIYCDNLK